MIKSMDIHDSKEGTIRLLATTPTDRLPWGDFESLRRTSWALGVQIVSAEALSHALHGWVTPLIREFGTPTDAVARRVTEKEGRCRLSGNCIGFVSSLCRPGGRGTKKTDVGPPACYDAPFLEEGSDLASRVALAWKEGRRTVVVVGEEFVLT